MYFMPIGFSHAPNASGKVPARPPAIAATRTSSAVTVESWFGNAGNAR